MDVTIKNGMRGGTFESFIKPIRNRRNLKIFRYSHVTKVSFIYFSPFEVQIYNNHMQSIMLITFVL